MFKKLFHKCIPTDCSYITVDENNRIILAKCMICGKCYMYLTDKKGNSFKKRISKSSYEHAKKIYGKEKEIY